MNKKIKDFSKEIVRIQTKNFELGNVIFYGCDVNLHSNDVKKQRVYNPNIEDWLYKKGNYL